MVLLAEFAYGRQLIQSPRLELIAPCESEIQTPRQIEPGSLVLTEYPELTAKFLRELGHEVVHLEQTREAPSLPSDFRLWCKQQGVVGLRTVHGGVAVLVREGFGFGVMVNETGKTLENYRLRPIGTIMEITTQFLADSASYDPETVTRPRIDRLHRDLGKAYVLLTDESRRELGIPRGRKL